MSAGLPRSADIVIIGAGAIGASIAYQLGRRGARDVVVLERDTVGAGSTTVASSPRAFRRMSRICSSATLACARACCT